MSSKHILLGDVKELNVAIADLLHVSVANGTLSFFNASELNISLTSGATHLVPDHWNYGEHVVISEEIENIFSRSLPRKPTKLQNGSGGTSRVVSSHIGRSSFVAEDLRMGESRIIIVVIVVEATTSILIAETAMVVAVIALIITLTTTTIATVAGIGITVATGIGVVRGVLVVVMVGIVVVVSVVGAAGMMLLLLVVGGAVVVLMVTTRASAIIRVTVEGSATKNALKVFLGAVEGLKIS